MLNNKTIKWTEHNWNHSSSYSHLLSEKCLKKWRRVFSREWTENNNIRIRVQLNKLGNVRKYDFYFKKVCCYYIVIFYDTLLCKWWYYYATKTIELCEEFKNWNKMFLSDFVKLSQLWKKKMNYLTRIIDKQKIKENPFSILLFYTKEFFRFSDLFNRISVLMCPSSFSKILLNYLMNNGYVFVLCLMGDDGQL